MEEIYFYLTIAVSSLSFLGCFYIIITVLIFHELRKFMFRLIMYLALSSILISISAFIPHSKSDTLCKIQGVILSIGTFSNILWTACIMFSVYGLLVKEKKISLKFEIITSLIIWFSSIIMAFSMINYYEEGSLWCWIDSHKSEKHKILSFIAFYIPYFFVVIFDLFICFKIRNFLRKCTECGEVFQLKQAAMKKFVFYPIILIICYAPACIHRFFETSGTEKEVFDLLAIVGNYIIGFAFFLIYALTRSVRTTVYKFFSPKIENKDYSLLSAEKLIKY